MPRLETYSTAGLAVGRRLEFWNDLTCSTFTPNVSDPRDLQGFAPSLSRSTLGEVLLSEVRSAPSIVRHTSQHVARTRKAMFFLHVQTEGRSCNRQEGREAFLDVGDLTLLDNTRPYQMEFEAPSTLLVVGIPDPLIRRHLPHPESAAARAIRRCDPLAALLVDLLGRLWALCQTDEARLNHAVECSLLSMIGAVYAGTPLGRGELNAGPEFRRLRILRFIEDHLGDADLGPTKIASALGTTPRNVHLTFSQGEETLCRYIQRRRLEECARIFADRAQQARTVSDVAFHLGFSSLTHFGKVFHDHFGVAATEYRAQRIREQPAAPSSAVVLAAKTSEPDHLESAAFAVAER
ncbi:MAG: helix-turn-helix domain-containing protein [Steroidobacteraceae bacterium]